MLFHTFNSQEQRRAMGGSCFIEIQFCKLPFNTELSDLVDVDNIVNWLNESLYVNDENAFLEEYGDILDCGTYNNMQTGVVDIYGINYYSSDLLPIITQRIQKRKPRDFEILLEWLRQAELYNGFYILGI